MTKESIMMTFVKIMMISIVVIIYSFAYAAEPIVIPVKIKCSENLSDVEWEVFDGETDVKLTLVTNGIQDIERGEDTIKVNKNGVFSVTDHGLDVHVIARCILSGGGSDGGKYISNTGDSIVCGEDEGLKVKVFEPNGSAKFYIGTLTKTKSKKIFEDHFKFFSSDKMWKHDINIITQ